jgi:hypothetical protein
MSYQLFSNVVSLLIAMLARSLMFSPAKIRNDIPENLRDRWIASLRKRIFGSNYAERCSALQALSICAGCSKQTSFCPSSPSLTPTKGEMRKKILQMKITTPLLYLFHSHDGVLKYCASRALIALDEGSILGFLPIAALLMRHPGDQQPNIAKDIIAWLVQTVGRVWRYRRTVKFLSEIAEKGKLALPLHIAL